MEYIIKGMIATSLILASVLFASSVVGRQFDLDELKTFVDQLEDEMIGHQSLKYHGGGIETKLVSIDS